MLAELYDFLPVLVPLLILDLTLKIFSLRILLKYPEDVKGNRLFWIVVILVVQTLGPVLFLALGRERK